MDVLGFAEPRGCFACNAEVISSAVRAAGVDPARYVEVPITARARTWGPELVVCPDCGRAWLCLPNARRMFS